MNKKGELKAGILVFVVVMLLFFVVSGIMSLALTAEEEKAQLEAELDELEQTLAVISAGLGQDFGGLLCGVDRIKYNDYKCDNIGFHVVKVLNQFIDDSDLVFDGY